MADFTPPTGPPPPKVLEGWKAIWNEHYSEYFYVNVYTKVSQWEKPTSPVYPPGEAPLDGAPPPAYDFKASNSVQLEKSGLSSSNSYNHNNPDSSGGVGAGGPVNDISEDEKLARRLQEEEDAWAQQEHLNQGSAGSYYQQAGSTQSGDYVSGQQQGSPLDPHQSGVNEKGKGKAKGGFLGKLLNKASALKSSQHGSSHHSAQQHGYPQSGYAAPYSAPYGHPPQGGGAYGYSPQQPYSYGRPQRHGHGGIGPAGAVALGAGGGLLGGMLLADAAADAGDYGGDYGGDGGGFGGDGGGDFGGGDFGGGGF